MATCMRHFRKRYGN